MKTHLIRFKSIAMASLCLLLFAGCSKKDTAEIQPEPKNDSQVVRKDFATREELDEYVRKTRTFTQELVLTEKNAPSMFKDGKIKLLESPTAAGSKPNHSSHGKIMGASGDAGINYPAPSSIVSWNFDFSTLSSMGYPS